MKSILGILVTIFILTTFGSSSKGQTSDATEQIKTILSELKDYNYPDPEHWKPKLIDAMKQVYSSDKIKSEVEKLMLSFLKSDVSYDAKRAIWREFSIIATKESEKEIVELLKDKTSATLALAILDNSGLGSVDQFKMIIPELAINEKIGIINLLGNRKNEDAVKLLSDIAKKGDPMISMPIIFSLAKIGSVEAARVILKESENFSSELTLQIAEIKLICANRLIEKNQREMAQSIFQELSGKEYSNPVRATAMNGLFKLSNNQVEFIKEQLEQMDNRELKLQIIRLVIKLPNNYKSGNEFFKVSGLNDADKIELIKILSARNDKSINDIVNADLTDENPEVRMAALEAIPKTGSENDVEKLAMLTAETKGTEQKLARNALYTLPGKSVDNKIVDLISTTSPNVKIELVKAVGERNMTNASDALFKLAKSVDEQLKLESIEALGNISDYSDLNKILGLLVNSTSPRERMEIEKAVVLVASKNPNPDESSKTIVKRLNEVNEKEIIISLISILGKLANPDDYGILGNYFNDPDPDVKIAAVKAVAEWPTDDPLNGLLDILKNTTDARLHALAMRSLLQIIESAEDMTTINKIKILNTAFQLSSNISEQRMVLAGYSKIYEPESLQQLTILMKNEAIKPEVEMGIQEMVQKIRGRNDFVIAEIKKIMELSDNESFLNYLKEEVKKRSE